MYPSTEYPDFVLKLRVDLVLVQESKVQNFFILNNNKRDQWEVEGFLIDPVPETWNKNTLTFSFY